MTIRSLALWMATALVACGGPQPASPRVDRTPPPAEPAPPIEGEPDDHLIAGLTQISCGRSHTCAVDADGQAYCWGANLLGQLGIGTRINRDVPVPVRVDAPLRSISAGARSTCAIDRSGAVWCWGANEASQLGDDETTGRIEARRIEGLAPMDRLSSGWASPRRCGVDDSGVARCWGELGTRLDAGLIAREPDASLIATSGPVTAMSVGRAHECALLGSGEVLCRGIELPQAARDTTARFTRVPGVSAAHALAAGGQHVCVATDGGVRCWGDNRAGQLGDGSRTDATEPTSAALEGPIDDVVAGAAHTCARTADGRVYCWGSNEVGQVGAGGSAPVARPTAVRLDAPAADLCAGLRHTCALTESGAAYCWGENRGGQLGDGTMERRELPVAVLEPGLAIPQATQERARHVPAHGPISHR